MNKNIIEIDDERKIIVVDDAFSFAELSGLYTETVNCKYTIYNSSDCEIQNLDSKRLGCPLEIDSPILKMIFTETVTNFLQEEVSQSKYYASRAYINLGIHSDPHKIHVDDFSSGSGKTVLIYLNRNWDRDWGGETLFYDDNREEIKYISPFIPGRIIVFDGSIPHSAKPQHFNAPPYRFTLALKFRIHEQQ
jgi:SM-20-related protein